MMNGNYAVIENGVVINVILWDGETPLGLPNGQTTVLIPDGSPAWIGWGYDGTEFTPPSQ